MANIAIESITPSTLDATDQVLVRRGAGPLDHTMALVDPAEFGDAVGPASATDNALARFDGTTGKLIQNSAVTLDDNGAMTLPAISTPSTPAADRITLFTKGVIGQRDAISVLLPNGREAKLQEDGSEFLQFRYRPASNSALLVGDGTLPQTITGSATAGVVQATELRLLWPRVEARAGTPAVNAVAGFRGGGTLCRVGNDANAPGGFNFNCVWGPSGFSMTSTHRACCGLINSTIAPTDVEPSSQVDGIWMGWDAADTNIQMMHNDATGTATKIDLGSSFAVPTGTTFDVYLLQLFSPNSSTQSVEYRVIKYNTTARTAAAEATGTITTDIPAVGTLLANRAWCSAGGTSAAIGVSLYGVEIDLDY